MFRLLQARAFSDMDNRSILISGAGIAGPALALWLRKAGFAPVLVERSPSLRTGGYIIDFWGLGYDIAERMGLRSEIDRVGYHMREFRIVDNHGERIAGFGMEVFGELTGGHYVTIGRSDLSRLLFEKAKAAAEVIFDNEIIALDEMPDGVNVHFKRGENRRFDLVIGADGLHSDVRGLVFGSQHRFETYLGYRVAAFEVSGYRPRNDDIYVMHGRPGRMIGRFTLREDRTLFLFVFNENSHLLPTTIDQQKAILCEVYGSDTWECPQILEQLDHVGELYFDRVSQIRMANWSNGRVALVGDAAFCVSLLAGQGSALAILSAYVLAGELASASGEYREAFARYESFLRPFVQMKQSGAEGFAAAFAPRTPWGLWFRNQMIRAFAIPGLARLTVGREITDSLKLPDYRWPSS